MMGMTGVFITKFNDYYSRNGERVKILKEHKGHALIEYLRNADSNNRGGISDQELDYYEGYFKTI